MSVVRVYRPPRDWKGQRPKNLEESYIGDVTGVVVGGAAPQPLARFPGVVTTEGQFGFPYEQESGIIVEPQDLLVLNGEKYLVTGPRMWEEDHVLAGSAGDVVDDYYWMEVRAS
jgi:hypothetical protein